MPSRRGRNYRKPTGTLRLNCAFVQAFAEGEEDTEEALYRLDIIAIASIFDS